jgi:hypothetical protein
MTAANEKRLLLQLIAGLLKIFLQIYPLIPLTLINRSKNLIGLILRN